MIKLIGLYGASRSGKDKTAKFLVDDFGFEQRNLADPIREMLLQINPILDDDSAITLQEAFKYYKGDWDRIKKFYPESVELMIRLGQSARDVLGENVWLNLGLKDRPEKLVIADCRQPNEYWKIKELGGQVWKITKSGTKSRGMDDLLEGYEFDAHIDNRGTLLDLRGMVQAVMATNIDNELRRAK